METFIKEILKRSKKLGLIWREGLLEKIEKELPEVKKEIDRIQIEIKKALAEGNIDKSRELLDKWEKTLLDAAKRLKI